MSASIEKRGPVGIIWVDSPPVNALSAVVRKIINDGCAEINTDPEIKVGILACRGRTFMAGADITEFGKSPLEPSLQTVSDNLDQSSKPIIAALFGTAFGGGLELALSCSYRVASKSALVGLPEVKLGILPGCGGTQRLPRLIGIEAALNAIVSGEPIPAPMAAKAGVIDKIIEGDLLEGAIAFAHDLIAKGCPVRRVSDIAIDPASVQAGFFDAARVRIAREKRNLHAPQRIIDCIEAATLPAFKDGMEIERKMIMACFANSQARAMQYVFFSERQVVKIPAQPAGIAVRPVNQVAVIGAGTMGGGIAMNFANAGIPVVLLEANQAGLDRGLGIIRKNYENSAAKGRISSEDVEKRMALIAPTLSYDALSHADMIIEAVFETMDVKKMVFAELDRVAKPGAILASNTSYLSIDMIADATRRPADVIGTHFFSPANVMRLCEVVRGAKTAPDVLATAMDVAKRIKKIGVVSGNCDGFIGNRMLQGYAREATLLSLEGASIQQIDKALFDFGMPMGMFQMGDLAGLDVGYKSRKDRDPATLDPRIGWVADRLVEQGRFGQKNNAGYYDYEPGNRLPIVSPITTQLIENCAQAFQIRRREISKDEIIERCFLALVNLGCDILLEKIAYRASDIDMVYLNGYGFPAYHGGPMWWAENEIGLANALDKMRVYGWKTSAFLEALVHEGRGFASV